jgi:hypothetical protein
LRLPRFPRHRPPADAEVKFRHASPCPGFHGSLSALLLAPAALASEALPKAGCVPNFENGKPAGQVCGVTMPDSVELRPAALKNGDIIRSVDGEKVSDPKDAFDKLRRLRGAEKVR